MSFDQQRIEAFSLNRLDGEAMPDDLLHLLESAEDLKDHTDIELHWEPDWNPWLHLIGDVEDWDRHLAARKRAHLEVCGMSNFIAVDDDQTYLGFWRGPGRRSIAASPLLQLDREGRFHLCMGSTFAEAVASLWFDEERFLEVRRWLHLCGITLHARRLDELTYPEEPDPPDDVFRDLHQRYLAET